MKYKDTLIVMNISNIVVIVIIVFLLILKYFIRWLIMRHIFQSVQRDLTMKLCVREKTVWNTFIKIIQEEKTPYRRGSRMCIEI